MHANVVVFVADDVRTVIVSLGRTVTAVSGLEVLDHHLGHGLLVLVVVAVVEVVHQDRVVERDASNVTQRAFVELAKPAAEMCAYNQRGMGRKNTDLNS